MLVLFLSTFHPSRTWVGVATASARTTPVSSFREDFPGSGTSELTHQVSELVLVCGRLDLQVMLFFPPKKSITAKMEVSPSPREL